MKQIGSAKIGEVNKDLIKKELTVQQTLYEPQIIQQQKTMTLSPGDTNVILNSRYNAQNYQIRDYKNTNSTEFNHSNQKSL